MDVHIYPHHFDHHPSQLLKLRRRSSTNKATYSELSTDSEKADNQSRRSLVRNSLDSYR